METRAGHIRREGKDLKKDRDSVDGFGPGAQTRADDLKGAGSQVRIGGGLVTGIFFAEEGR